MPSPPLDHLDLSAQGYFFFLSIAAPIGTPKDRHRSPDADKISTVSEAFEVFRKEAVKRKAIVKRGEMGRK